MSFSGVISGACSLLIGSSAFEAGNNIGFIDPQLLDTSSCRWVGMFAPGPIAIPREGFGKQDVVWSVIFQAWIKWDGSFTNWQNDHKAVIQDVVDALRADTTLAGSCEEAAISLVDIDSETRGERMHDVLSWLIEATEYGSG
jgi:hypothetical protein